MNILAIIASLLLVSNVVAQKGCQIGSICYAIDQSGSVDSTEYASFQNFTVSSARIFDKVAAGSPKYSAIAFSSFAKSIVNATTDVEGVLIPDIEKSDETRLSGGTNIYDGMRACADKLGKDTNGKARVLLLLTDGEHTVNGVNSTNPIDDYKRDGMAIVTVGVGFSSSDANLRAWASKPEFFVKADFKNITILASQITKTTCKAADSVVSPTPIPAPSQPTPPKPILTIAPVVPVSPPTPPASPAPVNPILQGSLLADCQAAYDDCIFSFDNSSIVPEYDLPATPDSVFTGRIELKNGSKRVGIENSGKFVSEFIISVGKGAQPITAFGSQPFAPTTFKAFTKINTTGSGIGHEVFQGNQLSVARNRCVRVFFNSYQLFYPNGYISENVNLHKKDERACVVFRTKA